MIEERHSEEQQLQEAYTNAAGIFSDEPDSIDAAPKGSEENGTSQNGESRGTNADTDGDGDGEGESDDDMLDRISSSPSIDDGGSTPLTPSGTPTVNFAWPRRTVSLTPELSTPPMRTDFNNDALFYSSSPSSAASSPFVRTPLHLPLPRSRFQIGFENSPLAKKHDQVMDLSPSDDDLVAVDLYPDRYSSTALHTLKKHHQLGRYGLSPIKDEFEPEDTFDGIQSQLARTAASPTPESPQGNAFSLMKRDMGPPTPPKKDMGMTAQEAAPLLARRSYEHADPQAVDSPFRRHSWARNLLAYRQNSIETSASNISLISLDMANVLLPAHDPLLQENVLADSSSDSVSS